MSEARIIPMDVKRFRRLAQARQVNYRTEMEWLTVKDESRIGAVVYDRFDDDWSFIVLARDAAGFYKRFDLGIDHETQADAHRARVAALLRPGEESKLVGRI